MSPNEIDPDAAPDKAGMEGLQPRGAYTRALIGEIRILVRSISNDPVKRLSSIQLSYRSPRTGTVEELSAACIVSRVAEIEKSPKLQADIGSIAFLQLVRDALVAVTAPATGLTTAYTVLVGGGRRGRESESSFALAEQSYGQLRSTARKHRICIWILTIAAFFVTLMALWEATQTALAKNLLRDLALLRVQRDSDCSRQGKA